MDDRWTRTKIIYGDQGLDRLKNSRIALFGLGGVGSYAAEAILRSGVGRMDVYDFDSYEYSNFNRQLYADDSTVGILKVEAFRKRVQRVNPHMELHCRSDRLTEEIVYGLDFREYDYVIDAIDDIRPKMAIIESCLLANRRIISAMGAGNKMRPELLKISTIYRSKYCPFAKMVRAESKKRGLADFDIVYSEEQFQGRDVPSAERSAIGSTACVPSVMGLLLASKVINTLAINNVER